MTCIAEEELCVLSFDSILRDFLVDPVKRLSFRRLIEECDSQGVLMKVLDAVVKKWFNFRILRLIEHMNVDPTLAFRRCRTSA